MVASSELYIAAAVQRGAAGLAGGKQNAHILI